MSAMKHGYRPDEAAAVVGSMQLLKEFVAAGWLKPVVQRHKMTIYDFSDIAKCWQRVKSGDLPPPLKRASRKK